MLSIWQKTLVKPEVLKDPSPSSYDLFRLANQMSREKMDVQGEKPVPNDAGELCLGDMSKQAAWKEHCEYLSNVEFDWDRDSLAEVYPMEGPVPHIPLELVIKTIELMKCGKVAATSLIVDEMLKASGVEGAQKIRDLI